MGRTAFVAATAGSAETDAPCLRSIAPSQYRSIAAAPLSAEEHHESRKKM
jgi:hypothetical protein